MPGKIPELDYDFVSCFLFAEAIREKGILTGGHLIRFPMKS